MTATLEQLVNVRSQLVNEVLAYLDALAERAAELPAYYPAHLRTDETGKTRFDAIRQMVQVVEDRTAFERWRAEERERLRAAGLDYDRLAYDPSRARPEADERDAMHCERPKPPPPVPWDEHAGQRFRRAVILGDPGFGKTWLLRYEARRLARDAARQLRERTIRLDNLILPIFVRLSDVNQSDDPIQDALVTLAGAGRSETFRHFVREKLNSDRCVILLDAWDEVPVEVPLAGQPLAYLPHHRQRLGQRLEAFARQFPQPRLLLTSRIVGYTASPIPDAQELELLAFDRPQIDQFVRVWFGDATETAEQFLAMLRQNHQVRGLARIPLMLALICRAYQEQQLDFPTRRVDLYDRCLRGLLRDWKERKEQREVSSAYVEAVLELLEAVGYKLFAEGHEQFSEPLLRTVIATWLNGLPWTHEFHGRNPTSLIAELKRDGVFITAGEHRDAPLLFLHRTFHEYLAACYLANQATEAWLTQVQPHLWFDSHWKEVIALLAGCLADPNPLLEALLDGPDDAFRAKLLLAGLCLAEADPQTVDTELSEEIDNSLPKVLLSASVSDAVRAVQVLGRLGERAISGLSIALHSPKWNVRQDAAAALGNIGGTRVVEELLVVLQDPDGDMRECAARALGEIGDPRAVDRLLVALQDRFIGVAEAAAVALGKIGDPRAVDGLSAALPHGIRNISGAAAWALRKIGDPAIPVLLEALQDPNSDRRRLAAAGLWEIGDSQAIEELLAALHDPDWGVRAYTAGALGAIGDSQAIQGLVAALQDPDPSVRQYAAGALRELGDPQTVEELLIAALQDPDGDVRQRAVRALEKIDHPRAVEGPLAALQDPDGDVRRAAAIALGKIDDPRAVEGLLTALHDSDGDVRRAAAITLGEIDDPRAVEGLLAALQDADGDVRQYVVRALGKIGAPRAVDGLLAALQDPDGDVRRAAAIALGKIDDPRAVEGLLTALHDSDGDVRRSAAAMLVYVGDPQAVEGLLAALQDPDEGVRERAAGALGKINDPRAVDGLLAALQDPDSNVRRSTAAALGKIDDPRAVDGLLTALRNPDLEVRKAAARAVWLEKVGDPRAVEGLLAALQDPDGDVRQYVVGALGKIDDPRAVDGLLAALYDPEDDVRRAAAMALGRMGDPRAVAELVAAFRHSQPTVYHFVPETLEKLAKGQNVVSVCDHLLSAWLDPSLKARSTVYNLLMRLTPRLREAVSDAWPDWHARLMLPTDYMLALGLQYRHPRFHTEAEWIFRHLLERFPSFFPALKHLGTLLVRWPGRAAEVAALFEQYLESRPEDFEVWEGLGDAFSQLERYQPALEAFQRAADFAQIPPDQISCLDNCAKACLNLGWLDQAKEFLAKHAMSPSKQSYLDLRYAQLYLALGDTNNVEITRREFLKLRHIRLNWTRRELDLAAITRCLQTIKKNQHLVEAHFTFGLACLCAGWQDAAEEAYNNGLELVRGRSTPEDTWQAPEVQVRVRGTLPGAAEVLVHLRPDEVYNSGQKLARKWGELTDACRALEKHMQARGDLPGAAEILARLQAVRDALAAQWPAPLSEAERAEVNHHVRNP